MVDFCVRFFVFCALFIHLNQATTTTKRCKADLGNGVIKEHCCDNHEEINSTCVECEDGFKSETGEPCYKCPDGTFGRKCGDICNCDEYERCHHIKGCSHDLTEFASTVSIQTSDALSSAPMTPIPSTRNIDFQSTAARNSKPLPGEVGKMSDTIVIYIICTSGVTFVLTLSMVSLNRFFKRNKRNPRNRFIQIMDGNRENDVEMNQVDGEYERVYETIDESQLIDMSIHNNEQNDEESTGSADNGMIQVSDDDDYLNPYQPIIPDSERHEYCSEIKALVRYRSIDEITPVSGQRDFREQGQSSEYMTTRQNVSPYIEMRTPRLQVCTRIKPVDSPGDTAELCIVTSTAETKRMIKNQLSENLLSSKIRHDSNSQNIVDICIPAPKTQAQDIPTVEESYKANGASENLPTQINLMRPVRKKEIFGRYSY